MARRKKYTFSRKNLGIAMIVALIIQFILPQIKLSSLSWLATLIYLAVAIILLFF